MGIFPFVELVGSVPFYNRTPELPLGAERFHSIPPHSRTEHTRLTNEPRFCLVFDHNRTKMMKFEFC
jgi:hypothetical protein